jgi:hypothetical protein
MRGLRMSRLCTTLRQLLLVVMIIFIASVMVFGQGQGGEESPGQGGHLLRGDANDPLVPLDPGTEADPQPIISEMIPIERTATGGYIHTLLILLTFVSFIGNGFFLVDAFWMIG